MELSEEFDKTYIECFSKHNWIDYMFTPRSWTFFYKLKFGSVNLRKSKIFPLWTGK